MLGRGGRSGQTHLKGLGIQGVVANLQNHVDGGAGGLVHIGLIGSKTQHLVRGNGLQTVGGHLKVGGVARATVIVPLGAALDAAHRKQTHAGGHL